MKTQLEYNKDTGVITWLTGRKAGKVAGTKTYGGYVRITVNGKAYYAHRLAWLFEYGEYPDTFIDHINRDKTDNRINNLRAATHKGNNENVEYKGYVYIKNRDRYVASIMHNYKKVYIGSYKTAEEAHRAYISRKEILHTTFKEKI